MWTWWGQVEVRNWGIGKSWKLSRANGILVRWDVKVSVGTGNDSELLRSGAARVVRIVLSSAGEIAKLRSGARRP